MVMIIGKNSIEEKVRREAEGRRIERRQVDIITGLTKTTGPQRGDYRMCREADKILLELNRTNDARARKEIAKNYFDLQKSYRESARRNER